MAKPKNFPTDALIALSDAAIRAHCESKVWQRGCELADSSALSDLMRAGDELFGSCEGSYGEPYQLQARLEKGALASSNCSCPFDGGGLCKHRVALLLRYAQSPDEFTATPSTGEMIGALKRDELNALLENLVRREPALLPTLVATYEARQNIAKSGAPAPDLRLTLRKALGKKGAEPGRVALDLAAKKARDLEAGDSWDEAGEIWRVLLESIVAAAPRYDALLEAQEESYEDYYGDEDEFDSINSGEEWSDQAVEGLERCLSAQSVPSELRERWLRALWQAWLDTHYLSYFLLSEDAMNRVLEAATSSLWNEVEATLMQELQSAHSDQSREETLALLSYGLEKHGEEARVVGLLRQYGSYRQKLALLMKEKNYGAVEALALENSGSQTPGLLEVASDMDKAGQTERALRLARRAQQPSEFTRFPSLAATEWLARFYLRHDCPADAQREAAALWRARPGGESLELWKSAVSMNGDWDESYGDLENAPEMTALLRLQLAILDDRAARALELYQTLETREQPRFTEAIARVCEADLPAQSAEFYQQMGINTMAKTQGGYGNARPLYREAAGYWKRAQQLHRRLGTLDEWSEFIGEQREQNRRRPAFLDELKQAGL